MDHLAQALEVGEAVDVGRLVAPEKRHAIEAAMAALGPSPLLKPIMERLGAGYTYDEIRLVRAAVQQIGRPHPPVARNSQRT
jgi:ATP-dependent DNA helicase RecQ